MSRRATNRRDQTSAELVTRLGGLPLQHHPGTVWEYSRSTDVLGRLVEVISGQTLGAFLAERILAPLGMADTGFQRARERAAPPRRRLCGRFPTAAQPVNYLDVRRKPVLESGGGGLVSTIGDYARFVQLMAGHGQLGTVRCSGARPSS